MRTRTRRLSLLLTAATLGLSLLAAGPADAAPRADRHQDAVDAVDGLMTWWNDDTGAFESTGWWNNANDLQALLDFWQAPGDTGGHDIKKIADRIYEKNVDAKDGRFRNEYLDDTGWWGLAWLRAYDLTGEKRYLDTAIADADHMWKHHDNTCGGGVWWNYEHKYKNSITNELFITLSAGIHNRLDGDSTYLGRAQSVWGWFQSKKLINKDNLINDGLNDACVNTGESTTWTYNQGVILGGLVELHKATGSNAPSPRAARSRTRSPPRRCSRPTGSSPSRTTTTRTAAPTARPSRAPSCAASGRSTAPCPTTRTPASSTARPTPSTPSTAAVTSTGSTGTARSTRPTRPASTARSTR